MNCPHCSNSKGHKTDCPELARAPAIEPDRPELEVRIGRREEGITYCRGCAWELPKNPQRLLNLRERDGGRRVRIQIECPICGESYVIEPPLVGTR